MKKHFEIQETEKESLTEEDIKRLSCKRNGVGGDLVPGDKLFYYILEVDQGTVDENGGKNMTMQVIRIANSVVDQLEDEYEFVRMNRTWPVLRKK